MIACLNKVELTGRKDVYPGKIDERVAAVCHGGNIGPELGVVFNGVEEDGRVRHRIERKAFLHECIVLRRTFGQRHDDQVLDIFEVGLRLDCHARMMVVPMREGRSSCHFVAKSDE